ncbi:RidA family protein [Paenibacillus marinisediminis]
MSDNIPKYGTDAPPFSNTSQSETLLFVSGQAGLDPVTGEIVSGDLEEQTVATVRNIERILSQSGLGLQDIVKVNVFLTDRNHYEPFNQIYSKLLPQPFPARTLIYCELNFDLLVEIDVIATLRKER